MIKRLPLFSNAGVSLVLLAVSLTFAVSSESAVAQTAKSQEFYELRIYRIFDFEKQAVAETYLSTALMPALKRQGIGPVGVFVNQADENDHSVFMLIPFSNIEQFTQLNANLSKDEAYQSAAADYFQRSIKDPVYSRIESRFLKAFAGIPKMEVSELSTQNQPRIFELRLYQSHTEDHARRKIKMFNEGEIQVMRDTGLGPVFFGETLIGSDVPNLVYMLSGADDEAHKQHWKDFLAHPEWNRIKGLEEYKDTVSKIENWFLKPTSYSQL